MCLVKRENILEYVRKKLGNVKRMSQIVWAKKIHTQNKVNQYLCRVLSCCFNRVPDGDVLFIGGPLPI